MSATSRQTLDDPVGAGYEALARGAWVDARERFESALACEESPEAWEGLGWAGWWLSDEELTLRSRERAYQLYRGGGDRGGAARVAAWLAADFAEFSGQETVGRGWLERARRLLRDTPEGPDHGWLAAHEGHFALSVGEPEEAARLGAVAARLGQKFGVPDLEAVGLAQEGIALVGQGRVEDGMRRLDEASVIASGEDLELPACAAWSLCYLISACAGVGDLPRAEYWCDAMRAWAERWGSRSFLGVCRVSYGRLLSTQGRWDAAESELVAAVADLEAARPGMAASGLVRLAELRLRQGRVDEARALLERAAPRAATLVGLGELALEEGDAAAARDAAERVLRRLPAGSILDRLSALELLARAEIAAGDLGAAAVAAEELNENAQRLGTPYLLGRAHVIAAELAAARGDLDAARRSCEDAIDRFGESSAPYEAALARLVLARVLAALGRAQAAEGEAAAALATFTSLGASRDASRAEALLARAGEGAGAASLGDLTARELDVLRLVAQGLSDSEIAKRLVVSPHTVHRHVANVRAKLRLPSRAAAVAYATREGLL